MNPDTAPQTSDAPDEIPDEAIRAVGLADPERARRMLLSLAGQGVTDDLVAELIPSIFDALRQSPDPDRALNNFARWIEALNNRYTYFQYLLGHPAAVDIFFNVCGVSQFFSDILIRSPEYLEILANPGVRGGAKSADALYRELGAFVDHIQRPELKLEAMRRFKQREILRIGTRDILGLADMPTTAREFSNLADASVQKCYEMAVAQLGERYGIAQPVPFAIVGMGKLGGRELNYSSDIDLMFVCFESAEWDASRISAVEYAHKLAESIIASLSKNLQNGHLFRVDMRLRPEGRFGPLVRTLASYETYYESWAEPWERQALLKARPIAGDPLLGERFARMIEPYVYRRNVTSDFVDAIRENKRRIEKKAEIEGQTHTNVKIGFGGIRDIEFAAQLLQLELGGRYPQVRTPTTLDALARLTHAGAITRREADELSEDYRFLRTVEHRLQILYELQTQSLPKEPEERRLLARRLGYSDAAAFDADYERRTRRVHGHFEAIFYGERDSAGGCEDDPWRDLVGNVETRDARDAIHARLAETGFAVPERAYAILKNSAYGGEYGRAQPEAREAFLSLCARLLAACARTGDPDGALTAIETLAVAMPNRGQLYRALNDSQELLERLCVLGAGSPPLVQSLARRLEWLDLLVSEEIIDPAVKTAEQASSELAERLAGGRSEKAFWDALSLYVQRERLRIGARDLWGEIPALAVCEELTALADAVIGAALERIVETTAERFSGEAARAALESVAMMGLGKLGGRELGYGSDWDIALVYADSEDGGAEPFAAVNALAERLLAAGQELRSRGCEITLDARLRPEGRFGALARTVGEYRAYYRDSALTWERQALTKARFVAGSAETGRDFLRVAHAAIYNDQLSEQAQDEIRAMKRRMENERLKADERHTDLKLGHGGMSDIEFTAQLWQMRAGAERPQARVTQTVGALRALGSVGTIPAPDAARLAETYAYWTAIRNRLALVGGISTNVLPADDRRVRAVAVGLGIVDSGDERAETRFRRRFDERMRETRRIVDRLFYGGAEHGL